MSEQQFNTPFISEELHEIRKGHLSLGVPIYEGAVHIRSPYYDAYKRRLYVDKTRKEIKIGREDGSLLQVMLHPHEHQDVDAYTEDDALPLLTKPVQELTFLREDDLWVPAGEGVEVISAPRAIDFARVLGQYAILKQQDNAWFASLKKIRML